MIHYIAFHVSLFLVVFGFGITAAGIGWGLILSGLFLAFLHGGCYLIDKIEKESETDER